MSTLNAILVNELRVKPKKSACRLGQPGRRPTGIRTARSNSTPLCQCGTREKTRTYPRRNQRDDQ